MTPIIDPRPPFLTVPGVEHHPDDLPGCLKQLERISAVLERIRLSEEMPYAEDTQDQDVRIWHSRSGTITFVMNDMGWETDRNVTLIYEAPDMDEGFGATLREIPTFMAGDMMREPLVNAEALIDLCLSACRRLMRENSSNAALDALMSVEGAAWEAISRLSRTSYHAGVDRIVVAAPSPWTGAIIETFVTPDAGARRMDTTLRELAPLAALPRFVEVHASETGFALEVHAAIRSGDVIERMRAAVAYAALRRGDPA